MGEIILQKRLISQQISMKMTRFSKTLVFSPQKFRGLFSVLFFWKSRMILVEGPGSSIPQYTETP
jgi:hypothetical protein